MSDHSSPELAPPEDSYAAAINRASLTLLAMSLKPNLRLSLIGRVIAAVESRGGCIEGQWLIKQDLDAALDDIADAVTGILSVALRERLPGIADEIDDAFGDRLRTMLQVMAQPLPTL